MDSHVEDAEWYVREAGDGPGTAIEAEGYQVAAHGIDFVASIAAGLDLQSTPRLVRRPCTDTSSLLTSET